MQQNTFFPPQFGQTFAGCGIYTYKHTNKSVTEQADNFFRNTKQWIHLDIQGQPFSSSGAVASLRVCVTFPCRVGTYSLCTY